MKLGSLLLSFIAFVALASPSLAQVSEADRLARCQNNQERISALENEIKNSNDLMTVEQLARARADLLSARQKVARLTRVLTDLYAMENSSQIMHINESPVFWSLQRESETLMEDLRVAATRYDYMLDTHSPRGYADIVRVIEARIGRALASEARAQAIEAEIDQHRTRLAALQCGQSAGLKIAGTWYREGDRTRPASVSGSGANLVFVNEFGMSARGHVSGPYTVVADDWEGGLVGMITDNGHTIAWGNGTNWRR